MDNLIKHFENVTKILSAKYEASKSPSHPGLKGTLRENFVNSFLREHLPKKAVIESGQIFDSKMRISPQQDLVLYHSDIPIIHLDDSSNLLFIEGVLAVIEVKSELTKKKYFDSIDNYKKLFTLERNFSSIFIREDAQKVLVRTPFYIFAYDGPDSKTLEQWSLVYKKKLDIPQDWENRYRPDCICVLNKYTFFTGDTMLGRQLGSRPVLNKHSLFFFFLCLAATVPPFLALDVNWASYIGESLRSLTKKNH